jgi:predicted metal-dependent phosphoesterase TrpH
MRRLALTLAVLATVFVPGSPQRAGGTGAFTHLVGGLHTHTGYSDGEPGTTPADAYARARDVEDLDFMAVTEHSEALPSPTVLSEGCLESPDAFLGCRLADADPLNAANKWDAQRRQATFATDLSKEFTALRGFEWTSDVHGHINVYFSRNYPTRAEGGEASVEAFYQWLRTPPLAGGGADGLATFNHPSDKDLDEADPRRNWNDFAYVPDLDDRIVAMELFNRRNARYEADFVKALNRGWHLGAVGAEDIHDTDWGASHYAKTVFLSEGRTPADFREAMAARRMYAVMDPAIRIHMTAGDEPMGSRIRSEAGTVPISVRVDGGDVASVTLVSNHGEESTLGRDLSFDAPVEPDEHYYFVRVTDSAGRSVAYSSPVWIAAGPPEAESFTPRWVAGDFHIHTTYSHDSYGGPHDHNTDIDEAYTAGWTPGEQIAIAESRDLDFMTITDHNNTLGVFDPAFSSDRLTLVPGYEKSLSGHAQMIGATSCFTPDGATTVLDDCPRSFNTPEQVRALAEAIRAAGGVFQVNHPSDTDWLRRFGDGSAPEPVVPDSVEVWNIGAWVWQPPAPSSNDNDFSLRFWETYLNAGYKVAATGGSDNHWRSTTWGQGVGQPTTWVYVTKPGVEGIIEGIRAGRTSLAANPPGMAGPKLTVEVDADGDGSFESMIGDTVPAGAPMRIRTDNLPPGAFYRINTSEGPLPIVHPAPSVYETTVPSGTWFYVEMRAPDSREPREMACDPVVGSQTTLCRNRVAMLAMSSALYVE